MINITIDFNTGESGSKIAGEGRELLGELAMAQIIITKRMATIVAKMTDEIECKEEGK